MLRQQFAGQSFAVHLNSLKMGIRFISIGLSSFDELPETSERCFSIASVQDSLSLLEFADNKLTTIFVFDRRKLR